MSLFKKILRYVLMSIAIIVCIGSIIYIAIKPSNTRDWSADQALLPSAELHGNKVTIRNIRNFTYTSTSDYTPAYYDATYDLSKLKKVWYIVEPFAGYGAAHTFLSFEFENEKYVAISVEIRKEKGEKFSPLKGLLKRYELMYVVGDERDLIKLRSNYRKDQVYMYPMKASDEGARNLFLSMIDHMNKLQTQPEFYNTVFNNCTTNIASHVNQVAPGHVPWSFALVLPKNSDKLALELGLIDTSETTIEKIREAHHINALAEQYADSSDFSRKIRRK
jgi:hypothetical protein